MPNHYTTMAICSPGWEFDVAKFNEQHKESNLCGIVKPMPENVEDVPSVLYPDGTNEAQRRGEPTDWYDWANNNWGTKWGTYGVEAFALGGDASPVLVKFQSAWSAPKILDKIAEWLGRVYGFENVVFVGFDPFDDSTKILASFEFETKEG